MHIEKIRDDQSDRIRGNMTMMDAITALAEGNPGALRVCLDLYTRGAAHDPDNMLEGIGCLLGLDTQRIYGSRIWALYKDVCGEDLGATVAVLRAAQLGIISAATLSIAIDNRGRGITLGDLEGKVLERLPNFRLKVS